MRTAFSSISKGAKRDSLLILMQRPKEGRRFKGKYLPASTFKNERGL